LDTVVAAFLEHGVLGLLSLVLLVLYIRDKGEVRRVNDEMTALQAQHLEELRDCADRHRDELARRQDAHLQQVDKIRLHQIQREQEVAETLRALGEAALDAIDKCDLIADTLRSAYNGTTRRG